MTSRYQWFSNKSNFTGMNTGGIKLDVSSLKLLLLNEEQQFKLKIKNNTFKIKYIAKCKIVDSNKLALFGIAITNKVFIIRINDKYQYAPEKVYAKNDFLNLCTIISKKLKFE